MTPVSLHYSDRRHWELNLWRLNLVRWCPGAPCYVVPYRRHWIRIRIWARSGSARDRRRFG
jgi:hypothetical protein